jgi:hypothetical protein
MKMIALFALTVFLMVAGVTLAQQSGNEKKGSSMQDTMQQMMKRKQSGEGMGGMMGMMKMMEQCSDMMKSDQHQNEKRKETQKQ